MDTYVSARPGDRLAIWPHGRWQILDPGAVLAHDSAPAAIVTCDPSDGWTAETRDRLRSEIEPCPARGQEENDMKARITSDAGGYVTAEYDIDDQRVTRVFCCPEKGGYVREQYGNGEWKQVCDGLAARGATLYCSSRAKLLDMIRTEYRAMRRAARYA